MLIVHVFTKIKLKDLIESETVCGKKKKNNMNTSFHSKKQSQSEMHILIHNERP